MKIKIITVGKPKLEYAKLGWDEYFKRLSRIHQLSTVHINDKFAYDSSKIAESQAGTYKVVLEIQGKDYSSEQLAIQLNKLELVGKEVSFLIGGPEGLPEDIRRNADLQWSLGSLTFPHDLAMINVLEALYRASMISAGLPYHK